MTEAQRRSMRALVATLLGNPTPFEPADLPLDLVRRHMLAPLAYKAGVAAFRNDYIASSLQAERRAGILTEAVTALSDSSIPVLLLKGIAYAGTIYPDPAERPMSDIDLMVLVDDVEPAARVLGRVGYWNAGSRASSTVTRHAITLKRRDASIDLHRHMLHIGRSRVDLDAIWRDARSSNVPGARRPAPLHEYLLHVAHIGRHEGNVPLVNFVDASRLHGGIVAAELEALAKRWSVARATDAVEEMLDHLRAASRRSGTGLAFPSPDEIFDYTLPPRWLQIIRKMRMVDDWRGIAGLAVATIRSRVAPLRRRS